VSLGHGSAKQGHKYIIALDAMRFLAASLVMVYHLGFLIWASEPYHPGLGGFPVDYEWLAPFAAPGWVGVQIFFVISGLVIIYSAEGATAFRFFRSRFLRLVPAVWICATITALVLFLYGGGPFSGVELAKAWLKSVTFYPLDGWIDGAYWTLSVEISFYTLVFAVIACGAFHRVEAVIGGVGLASASFWFLFLALHRAPVEYGGAWAAALDAVPHQRLIMLGLLRHGLFLRVRRIHSLFPERRPHAREGGLPARVHFSRDGGDSEHDVWEQLAVAVRGPADRTHRHLAVLSCRDGGGRALERPAHRKKPAFRREPEGDWARDLSAVSGSPVCRVCRDRCPAQICR
jgi:hypothetical protein